MKGPWSVIVLEVKSAAVDQFPHPSPLPRPPPTARAPLAVHPLPAPRPPRAALPPAPVSVPFVAAMGAASGLACHGSFFLFTAARK